ncbi:MAG: hypothetical protein QM489_03605 [Candidatus Izemoplasma sp.]
MIKLFRNKSYILLFLGGIVSEIGSTLYIFAIGIFILEVTGSSLETAMFMSLSLGIRVIVSPIAGVLVDKWNRVRVIYLTVPTVGVFVSKSIAELLDNANKIKEI